MLETPNFKLNAIVQGIQAGLKVISCCAIHNYRRKWGRRDRLFREWENINPEEIDGLFGNRNS